jgi:hypothetical protein
MQFMPTTFDTVNNDVMFTDFIPQDSSMSNFSNELDTAMAEAQNGKRKSASTKDNETVRETDEEKNSLSVRKFIPFLPRRNLVLIWKNCQSWQRHSKMMIFA